ncbi:MAG: hypothetical protein ACPG77_01810 [Nannocystaceae bacterium]
MAGKAIAVTLVPASLRRALLAIVAGLTTIGLIVEWFEYRVLYVDLGLLVPTFSLSYEGNVPTWYASSLLLACSYLLAVVARANPAQAKHWWGLCLGFAYISLDEAVGIHEAASGWFETEGWLYYGWVIPGAAVVVVLMGIYARFVCSLPRTIRNQVILAGGLYVGGALGMELPLGYWADGHGADNLGYALIDLVEESLELMGVSLFIAAQAEYLAMQQQQLQVVFTSASSRAETP